jgi:hypothetical protein
LYGFSSMPSILPDGAAESRWQTPAALTLGWRNRIRKT